MVLTTKDFVVQPDDSGLPVQTDNGPFEGDPQVSISQNPEDDYSLVTAPFTVALTAQDEVPA